MKTEPPILAGVHWPENHYQHVVSLPSERALCGLVPPADVLAEWNTGEEWPPLCAGCLDALEALGRGEAIGGGSRLSARLRESSVHPQVKPRN